MQVLHSYFSLNYPSNDNYYLSILLNTLGDKVYVYTVDTLQLVACIQLVPAQIIDEAALFNALHIQKSQLKKASLIYTQSAFTITPPFINDSLAEDTLAKQISCYDGSQFTFIRHENKWTILFPFASEIHYLQLLNQLTIEKKHPNYVWVALVNDTMYMMTIGQNKLQLVNTFSYKYISDCSYYILLNLQKKITDVSNFNVSIFSDTKAYHIISNEISKYIKVDLQNIYDKHTAQGLNAEVFCADIPIVYSHLCE